MKLTHEQTVGEEIANAVSHGVMAIFGIVAMILMLIKSDRTIEVFAAIIFGFGMINLYTMSTMYHSLFHKTAKGIFQRFDHLSIYILIGATFAPALLLIPELQEPVLGTSGIGLGPLIFIIQWILIAIGVVFKSIWIKKYMKLHLVLYLAMGWSAVVFIRQLYAYEPASFWFILTGGLAYSIGVIFYTQPKIKYFHFIWHLFTATGTILHFFAIYLYLY
ncbi:PAQR family membrane homeostasis protein TrhA [Mariniplasma anaerobium]|uniref:Hemolysin III family protein n=1 Tax=Mariniplasma anaerobium TaxID=2735436 RepID=A0A7U9XWJ3_9MOLU|nr:hemolysin III family protein [Mariniplasma anaerobium]BCR36195.1 hemolysin III family protein [Mariniplasma anaerobium]